ncbi:hypothetical protein BAUCODRAFT_245388 [Baudoinia panamericana UAMH 10762]|uniref:Heterokaryon incompatibility domain-containing protein n=1 Tax=Baudoinia panamericana (strain UAMH 10762) TaxID=717646 RepID=M2LHD3_BAUPA|nr:uncharacterized protein BAUCODRAFT_245388 [Baudoinia panamericana UAMH 10762]EMC93552.1 hypothetical protein BAUCODRAFT_245388 [Baudoinia panamericana UAMH 10762]
MSLSPAYEEPKAHAGANDNEPQVNGISDRDTTPHKASRDDIDPSTSEQSTLRKTGLSGSQHGQTKLCSRCEELQITPESFLIKDDLGSIGHRNIASSLRNDGHALRTGAREFELGTLQTVVDRASACTLCALISAALKRAGRAYNLGDSSAVCYARWEVDGQHARGPSRRAAIASVRRTRRLRIVWRAGERVVWEAFLILVAGSTPFSPNSDASAQSQTYRTFLGRKIEANNRKQALIKSWLDLCRKHHGEVCKVDIAHPREFDELIGETYFGVIDVVDLQLKPLPRRAKYAALSYVWGKGELPYRTVRRNAPNHREHGGLEPHLDRLPKAIQDSIKLVQQLGIRYLWVDSLCIVQDSSTSFKLNAQHMHAIYGNAYLTICAADGESADAGIIAMYDTPDKTDDTSAEIAHGFHIQLSRTPDMVISDTKWDRRAWTFQERMLSRRCVIFAEGRIYYQCRRTSMSEDIHNEATGKAWSLQSISGPLRSLNEINDRALSYYITSVPMYYRRELTRLQDVLSAYKGVESLLEKNMRAPFCFGLPTSHFDLALLWQPLAAGVRRKSADLAGQEFPSWAWCGWIGGEIGYDPDSLEGCLDNVHMWLKQHTWIRWHIRDGKGRLRPLWDSRLAPEDLSTEQRWRGYPGWKESTAEEATSDQASSTEEDSDDTYTSKSSASPDRRRDYLDEPVRRLAPRSRLKDSRKRQDKNLKFLYREPLPQQHHTHPVHAQRNIDQPYYYQPEHDEVGYTKPQHSADRIRTRRREASDARRVVDERYDDRAPIRASLRQHDDHGILTRPPPPPLTPELILMEPMDPWGRAGGTALFPDHEFPMDRFKCELPENLFGVHMAMYDSQPSLLFPDMSILQFWTIRTSLHIFLDESDMITGLSKCHVGDSAGDWCGTMTVNTDWLALDSHGRSVKEGDVFDFIALSQAEDFTTKEQKIWNYYIPSERRDAKWEVCYVLLIEKDRERHVWERVGLGKVFLHAFTLEGRWDEIMLG